MKEKIQKNEEEKIDFAKLESKWQKKWEEKKVFEVKEDSKKKKFYVLEMFPYPSASGLHMGHALNYTIGDIFARFKRMEGFNVLYPMGYDALGLPAENAAIKEGVNPKDYVKKSVANYIRQQKMLGLSYDWSRMVNTSEDEYYKWDQWIFLKMFEKGIAYKKKSSVNFCKKCNTVLANEQVVNGCCWRHDDTEVEIKHLEQWFFKITDYAEELYDKIDTLDDWPERIKLMQKNWIGKSHGTEIEFKINSKPWKIFTTRPDTLFGVTFMVVSAQHPRLMELVTKEQEKEVAKFLKKLKSVSEKALKESDELEKEGAFTGSYAINPLTNEKVPVYTGNFVVADYGSGMVMAVPAHDQRDFEFAKKYGIKIKEVISPVEGKLKDRAFTDSGKLINSGAFNDLDSVEAKEHITNALKEKKLGKKVTQYKLRDWLISRQRYFGTPIPIIYCNDCGIVSVPEKDLPVKLPDKVKFGDGNPLATNKEFVNVKCPKCGKVGRRETDTMDTFVNSSWYFLRYCDSKNNKEIFDKNKVKYWMPIDQYIGGAEHACMHLIYFRFYTKFLRDLGLLDFDEPAKRLFNQGMLHGEDGEKMSKSKGNVINPDDVSKKYGIDAARIFLVSIASPDKDIDWSEKGIEGSYRFVKNVLNFFDNVKFGKSSKKIEHKVNKTIKDVTKEIENFNYNLAVIKVRELFNAISQGEVSKNDLESFIKLLAPFAPHVAEELWEKLKNKNFISLEKWPVADEKKIDEKIEKQEKEFEKTVSDILNILKIINEKQNKDVEKIYIYVMPFEIENYSSEEISKRVGKEVSVFSVADKSKHDPQNFSKKAKPGRPAIYCE